MKVLYASFEASPYIKMGGLGDVAGTLPGHIVGPKCDIRVVVPYLSSIAKQYQLLMKHVGDFSVYSAGGNHDFGLYYIKTRGVTYYFIKSAEYFNRKNVYGEKDDLERFVFFTRAILESIPHMKGFKPQILHCNDWHTALANLYLREDYKDKLGELNIKTVFTIHNLQYQGKYKYAQVKNILELKSKKAVASVMHKGKVNLMKCGIVVSDCVTTPSPSYAKEIMTGEYGVGLENVLRAKKDVTLGILNGIDYVDFNPAWDTNIRVHFNKDLMDRRLGNKIDLQKKFKLDVDPYACLFCVACRFYEQKGIDLIIKSVPKIINNGGQILFLGDGDEAYKKKIREYKKKYKGKVGMHLQFDPTLPHNVYAGADVLLMPSKFEPCGIAQMMAMHYGTLPVVRSTGGLRDTVHDYKPKSLISNGFVFKNYNLKEFKAALDRVFGVWNRDQKNWSRMQRRGMEEDFSWNESGRKYTVLYRAILDGKVNKVEKILKAEAAAKAAAKAKSQAAQAKKNASASQKMAQKIAEEASNYEFVDISTTSSDPW